MTPPALAVALPEDALRPPEKSGKPDDEALADPVLPLAPALLDCEPDERLDGIEDACDDDCDDGDEDGMAGIDDDDDDDDDEELLDDDEEEDDEDDDDDDGICGMLDDCWDCCVDSHALSSRAVTLRLNRIRVRGIFMFADSNRRSQCLKCTVLKTGSRHHYCVSDSSLSIS